MAKANDKSDESLQVAESLIATMEEPDAVAYQCRKYPFFLQKRSERSSHQEFLRSDQGLLQKRKRKGS